MNLGAKHGVSKSLHGISDDLQAKFAAIYLLSSAESARALESLQLQLPDVKVHQQYQLYRLVRKDTTSEKNFWDGAAASRALTFSRAASTHADHRLAATSSSSSTTETLSDDEEEAAPVHSQTYEEGLDVLSGTRLGRR